MVNHGASLEGSIPVRAFPRLVEFLTDNEGDTELSLSFSKSDGQRAWLRGQASTRVDLVCQNCLEVFACDLKCSLDAVIVRAESMLKDLAASEDGIICGEPVVSVAEQIEDDLIFALPMVPKHTADCRHLEGRILDEHLEADRR